MEDMKQMRCGILETLRKENKSSVRQLIVVLFAVFCCSTSAVLVRTSTAPSLVLAAYRKTIVTILLLPFALTKYRKEILHMGRKNILVSCLSGVFLAVHFFSYFEAVNNTTISAAQFLTATDALFLALFMVISRREKYGIAACIGLFVTISGGAIITLSNGIGERTSFYGNIMAVLCAALLAAYSFIGAGVRKECSTTAYTFIVYGTAAVVLNIMVGFSKYTYFGYGKINYLTALGMAVFASLLGHSLLNWALKDISPTLLAMIKVLQPIFCTIWAYLFFTEIPSVNMFIGALIVIAGIFIYIKSKGITNNKS